MKTLYAIASRFAGPGIGRTAANAALGLHRAGHLAGLVCLGHEPTDINEKIISDVPFPPRGALKFLPDKKFYEAKNRWFDSRCQKSVTERFDTFHCWNSQATGSLKKARSLGIKTVVDRASSHIVTQTKILREQYAKYGIDHSPTYEKVVQRCVEEYEIADLVAVPSPFAYKSFADQGFDMSKVVFNPFGVDLSGFSMRDKPPEDFRLVFVGQVGIRKGVPALLRAWDRLGLKNASLVLAGGEEPAAENLLAKWKDRVDVRFAGFVKDVPALLRSSSAFVFPSCEEGSALVIYEAMACGLPIIATFNSGGVFTDGVSGLMVDHDDADALADKILALYQDREMAHEMGRQGRKQVEDYPWEAYGDRTAKLHQGLAKGDQAERIQNMIGMQIPTVN